MADPVHGLIAGAAHHSLRSVATWSLRERAVCSRPAAGPMSSARRSSDRHVNVFKFEALGNAAFIILRRNLVEPLENRLCVLVRDDGLLAEHRGMGLRSGDVFAP